MKPILDISEWQTGLNYAQLAKQIDGVIIRCGATGYGDTHAVFEDSRFEEHYNGFKAQGVPIGVYFYAGAPTEAKVAEEAALVARVLRNKKIDLPVYYDIEEQKSDYGRLQPYTRTQLALSWCRQIYEAGYQPGIYTYLGYTNLLNMGAFNGLPVWMAQYYDTCQYNGPYQIWQYTSDGVLSGASCRLDLSKVIDTEWYKRIISGTVGPEPIQTQKPEPEPEPEPLPEMNEIQVMTIGIGDSGNLVKSVQGILEANGFDLEYCGGCDGVFGQGTEYAVKSYQKMHGLDIDGIVGRQTYGAMLSN